MSAALNRTVIGSVSQKLSRPAYQYGRYITDGVVWGRLTPFLRARHVIQAFERPATPTMSELGSVKGHYRLY